MAKEPGAVHKSPDARTTKRAMRGTSPRAGSPRSAQKRPSESRADCYTLNLVSKTSRCQDKGMSKREWRKRQRIIHAKCLDEMDRLGQEFRLALAEIDDQKAYESQLLQKAIAEKADESSKLHQAVTAREATMAENQSLQKHNRQLQQQLESMNAALVNSVPWNDIQPVFRQTHGEMVTTATQYWNAIDALQNRRSASFFPNSGVINENWTGQYDPPGTLGDDALLGFSASGNPLQALQGNQGEAVTNNVFDALV